MKSLKNFVDDALKTVPEIGPEETHARLNSEWLLLDVREPDEFAAGRIPGAKNVPRGFLEVKADWDHPKRDPALADRSLKIVCYCGGGHRSALAAKTLMEMGFQDVVSMKEGWTGWIARDFPVENG
jgi:rhodanese-related sulfurtransferase